MSMTIGQAATAWAAFIIAAPLIGAGVVWMLVGRRHRDNT